MREGVRVFASVIAILAVSVERAYRRIMLSNELAVI
jgi:hypothetical protein